VLVAGAVLTTIPLVGGGLRIPGPEVVPTTGEWHFFVGDRGCFVFNNIRTIRDLADKSRLKLARKTPSGFEGVRYSARQTLISGPMDADLLRRHVVNRSDSANQVLLMPLLARTRP